MNYEEIRRTKEKFDAYVGSYIKTHPLESYGEIEANDSLARG